MGENILNHISDKGLISKIYKESPNLIIINKQVKNWAKNLNIYFSKNT
jgi:hypothetical protein